MLDHINEEVDYGLHNTSAMKAFIIEQRNIINFYNHLKYDGYKIGKMKRNTHSFESQ